MPSCSRKPCKSNSVHSWRSPNSRVTRGHLTYLPLNHEETPEFGRGKATQNPLQCCLRRKGLLAQIGVSIRAQAERCEPPIDQEPGCTNALPLARPANLQIADRPLYIRTLLLYVSSMSISFLHPAAARLICHLSFVICHSLTKLTPRWSI
jgi:hypothetical protein